MVNVSPAAGELDPIAAPPILAMCRPDAISEWRSLAHRVCASEEWDRAGRFRTSALERRFLCGRVMLRYILGEGVGAEPEAILLRTEASGRLRAPDLDLEPSISYVHGRVGALVGRGPIGLDLECPGRDVQHDSLASHVLTEREIADFEKLSSVERRDFFFRRWVEKEAVSKAMGVGLSVGFAEFDASAGAEDLGGDLHLGHLDDGCLVALLLPRGSPLPRPILWKGPGSASTLRIVWE